MMLSVKHSWWLQGGGGGNPTAPTYKWMAGGPRDTSSNGNNMIKSQDGITWVEDNIPNLDFVQFVQYMDGQWVAGGTPTSGSTTMAISEDTETWTPKSVPLDLTVRGVAHNGSRYVAVGLDSEKTSTVMYSDDFENWTKVVSSEIPDIVGNEVIYHNNKFIMVGETDAAISCISYSTDGVTWTRVNDTVDVRPAYDITFYNNRYYVSGGFHDQTLMHSPDLVNWTEVVSDIDVYGWGMEELNGDLVVLGKGTNEVAVTSDGTTFNTFDIPDMYALGSAATDGSKILATGAPQPSVGALVETTNGTNWSVILETDIELYCIAHYQSGN